MNQDLKEKNRRERLALWVASAGAGGVVNQSLAAWLLDVSRQRVSELVGLGRLRAVRINGLLLISFDSVATFSKAERLPGRRVLK